jgi:hypothetical protein
MMAYVVRMMYAFFHICRRQKLPSSTYLSRLPIETKEKDLLSDDDWLTYHIFDLPQEYTLYLCELISQEQAKDPFVKKLMQETPDRLGKMLDNVETKQKIEQATTICSPQDITE